MASTASGVNKKRPASEALESEQRLAKRFNLLNIDSNGKLYIPVAANPATASAPHHEPLPNPEPSQHKRAPIDDDWMPIDETKDRVYICDLEQELADIESDEENPIFLPDIEKHLNRIPPHLLKSKVPQPTQHNQLVLYSIPQSLSVPEDKDSVRKAIIEARARAGQDWSPPENAPATQANTSEPAGVQDVEEMATDGDEFPQDMDVEPMDIE
ncbi:hypothetical protein IWX90DRAFT_505150 [Phyllosticta citrichinensis]|uniref:Uncharacterized protein n=1 Tax=Phyllosticta citrichinensis TaxID=1130410 RepID=A0ABR1XR92_9PEZI